MAIGRIAVCVRYIIPPFAFIIHVFPNPGVPPSLVFELARVLICIESYSHPRTTSPPIDQILYFDVQVPLLFVRLFQMTASTMVHIIRQSHGTIEDSIVKLRAVRQMVSSVIRTFTNVVAVHSRALSAVWTRIPYFEVTPIDANVNMCIQSLEKIHRLLGDHLLVPERVGSKSNDHCKDPNPNPTHDLQSYVVWVERYSSATLIKYMPYTLVIEVHARTLGVEPSSVLVNFSISAFIIPIRMLMTMQHWIHLGSMEANQPGQRAKHLLEVLRSTGTTSVVEYFSEVLETATFQQWHRELTDFYQPHQGEISTQSSPKALV
ncbi:uncharacterized protein BJ212DRAFT_1297399 [Suillus subaureus]|uniref:Uncharacterized protein n=1 Tax=Suillus subaureus TaxID=48587 RepID=A0A9P7JGF4_9AGAM|nr:uncharacterized protein BJ212DRAFT_1297399 [Suillus subaureus]KAG1820918.1 hypothetical protein BJ212DRAFT_1297399 [Suillus subaureus]